MKIKIQSGSDIITNSSSEVFTIATQRTADVICEILDSLLYPNHKWDDLFTVKLRSGDYQNMGEDNKWDYNEDILEFEKHHGTELEYIIKGGNGETCPFTYVEVLPKRDDTLSKRVSKLFNNLIDTYEAKEYMC